MTNSIEHGNFCVYGHFNQPPRGNPLTGEISQEAEAAPYSNWNERIVDRCYRPNAEAGNFQHISFSVGETLLAWLEAAHPDVYQAIVSSDTPDGLEATEGNALATAYHHSILPLARRRDKRSQILW